VSTARKRIRTRPRRPARAGAALWYKDAIFYELRIGAFQDSDDDGIGDFRGLIQRLDYLRDLGVTTLWLLPFYPSPMRDDGYDISDYTSVQPESGTLEDFQDFLREAHVRGLRVVTELVLNHTSDQHPWFQRARRAPPGSRWRNFYVWSDTPHRYADARVIFKDFEQSNWTWDPVAGAYYWHRFYAHQPDLNYDSPDVRREILRVVDFWLGLGVDGLRLDAVPYLYEREGTNCENLPETLDFLRRLRRFVDRRHRDRMLLAEANQWPEDAVAYFGQGDACHMAFHFPLMPRLFMAMHMEDRFPIVDIMHQTPRIAESAQWALFLRNHDELTLEMVTDEERDYMYRVYAHDTRARINLGIRRRLAPLLGNDRRRIELMNALLFSLPGTPVIYYGDEIGMGDNFYLGDRNGVRTPMQWSGDRNAGFSRANTQKLYLPVIVDPPYHYEACNVEAQQDNPHSLLHWMKRLIALRKRYAAFGRGDIVFLSPSNRKVLAFVRTYGDERILVVANLSRFVEYVELDLRPYRGLAVVEVFGRKPFPPIGHGPYLLTLGPHSFYWFALERQAGRAARTDRDDGRVPVVRVEGGWAGLFERPGREALERALALVLPHRRWFSAKGDALRSLSIVDVVPVPVDEVPCAVTTVRTDTVGATPQRYALPLAWAEGERAAMVRRDRQSAVLVEVEVGAGKNAPRAVLYDATEEPAFGRAMLAAIRHSARIPGQGCDLVATPSRAFRRLAARLDPAVTPAVLRVEQSNTSIVYGDRLVLKLFRHLPGGTNPELEVGRFLTERTGFRHVAAVAGGLELSPPKGEPTSLGVLQKYVRHESDAWSYTVDQVYQYFDRILAQRGLEPPACGEPLIRLIDADPPPVLLATVGGYLEMARLLGRRTAELHQALASVSDDPAFAPEPFTLLYQRSVYQSVRNLVGRVLFALRERLDTLPAAARDEARAVLAAEHELLRRCHGIVGRVLGGRRIRCHGDFHLGQVLHTGKDFVIIDFEGEPAAPTTERRIKRSPLVDVAGMLRSFDYAAFGALFGDPHAGMVRQQDTAVLEPWARFWQQWVGSAFLRAYLHQLEASELLPRRRADVGTLLRAFLLQKAVYELGYELGSRPGWVRIPLRGILGLLAEPET